jgi:hypothetical protein
MKQPAINQGAPARAESVLRSVLPGAAMIAVTFGFARYGYGLLPQMQTDLGIAPQLPDSLPRRHTRRTWSPMWP